MDVFYKIVSNKSNALENTANMIKLISKIINDNFPDTLERQSGSDLLHQIKDYIDAGNGFGMNLNDFEKIVFQSHFYLEKNLKNPLV